MGKQKSGSPANEKALVAKARKQYRATLEETKRKQAEEDARWVDDDRHRKRAEQRRQAIQEKQDELVRKKEEKKLLLQHEDEEIYKSLHKPKGKDKPGNIKKTRAQVELMKMEREREAKKRAKDEELARKNISVQQVIGENPNQGLAQHAALNDIHEARTVEEAISALRVSGPAILPKKTMSYQEFEDQNLESFKADNPSMRLSQIKAAIRKAWQRSPANPANQA